MRSEVFNESNSSKEYDEKIKVQSIIKEYKELEMENRKLKKELNRQKKIKKELLSSNSLKYTGQFKKFFNKFG